MDHENLRIYHQVLSEAEGIAKRMTRWPRGYGFLVDQLRRACSSVVLTLAEGNAKRSSRAERHRFFEMTLGSLAEVAAALDLACAFGLIGRSELIATKSRLRLASVQIKALP